jgi:acyl-ACP thioesterase
MLSRLMVVVESYPVWGQAAVVRTWPCGSKSLLALRDFELLDKDGRRLAAATSGWLVFDQHSRRPLRIEPIIGSIRIFPERRSVGYEAPKLIAAETSSAATILKVKYSDLDLNNHVNNATYARWILDSYPVEFHRSHQVLSLAINFLAELDGNDSVELSTVENKDRRTHTVRRMLDGTQACRAEIVWQSSL